MVAARGRKKKAVEYRIDADEVLRGLDLLAPPVFELRVLNARLRGERRSGTFSGYDRDHFDNVLRDLGRVEAASACYFTPNYVNPVLLARSYNKARLIRDREPLTGDKDVEERWRLLIDVDAVRPAGVSATAAEKAAAEGLVTAIDSYLWEKGFQPGVLGDSGNGAHLMLPMRGPADDGGKVERLLKHLAKEFNTATATVDVTVFNAARIWKLPGTLVCKGDNAPEIGREWRMSRVLQVCQSVLKDA